MAVKGRRIELRGKRGMVDGLVNPGWEACHIENQWPREERGQHLQMPLMRILGGRK